MCRIFIGSENRHHRDAELPAGQTTAGVDKNWKMLSFTFGTFAAR
jgi:hypothetical protein